MRAKATNFDPLEINETDTNHSDLGEINLEYSYLKCKEIVLNSGFKREIEWQDSVSLNQLTETYFLREHAWVTLASGMKEKVIRNLFGKISNVFFAWQSASLIVENETSCRKFALQIFSNKNKIGAILMTSRIISEYGFETIKEMITAEPMDTLKMFPYIGPITFFHLAKNIGLPFAKPDRHLSRFAKFLGFSDVQLLCGYLSEKTGDSIPVVDIVLWKYATITKNYLEGFAHLSK